MIEHDDRWLDDAQASEGGDPGEWDVLRRRMVELGVTVDAVGQGTRLAGLCAWWGGALAACVKARQDAERPTLEALHELVEKVASLRPPASW
jgi:hypothetical protein